MPPKNESEYVSAAVMYCPYTPAQLAARAADLAADVERYKADGGPQPHELRRAPRLDDYRIAAIDGVVLAMGWCTGHPRLRSGPIVTAEVVMTGDGWLRTSGRLYRLGEPLSLDLDLGLSRDPDEADVIVTAMGR